MKRETRIFYQKALAIFLASMLLFTFLSRFLDSMTVARVRVTNPKRGAVSYEVRGQGTFYMNHIVYADVPGGFQVADVNRRPGQSVEAGDALFTLSYDDLEKEKRKLETELEKIRISLEEEKKSSVPAPKVTESQLAGQSLDSAGRALEEADRDLKKAEEKYAQKTAQLKREYEQNLNKTGDQLEEDLKRSYEKAKRAYDSIESKRERERNKAKRAVDDRQKALDRLMDQGASEEEIVEASLALERAREDLDEVDQELEAELEDARALMEEARADYHDMRSEGGGSPEAQKSAYESALEAEEEKLEAVRKSYRQAQENLRQAQVSVSNAQINDSGKRQEEERDKEISLLRQRSIQLDMEEKERELSLVNGLLESGGQVRAAESGVLTQMDIKPGTVASGDEIVGIGSGGLRLEGKVDRELANLIKPGAQVSVLYDGIHEEAKVESVDYSGEGVEAVLTAILEGEYGRAGATAEFTVKFQSAQYQNIIPLQAVYEDQNGFYCLAVQEKKTALGDESEAVRLNLTLLEKSETNAAVEGPIGAETELISGSSKTVAEGDRVRVER